MEVSQNRHRTRLASWRILLGALFVGCVLYPGVVHASPGRNRSSVQLAAYLRDVGCRFDVYFTVEEASVLDTPHPLISAVVESVGEARLLSDALAQISESLPQVIVRPNSRLSNVYHLIDPRLVSKADYPLNARIQRLKARGTLLDLVRRVADLVPGSLGLEGGGGGSSAILSPDTVTEVVTDLEDVSARDALTLPVPLTGYDRILWAARLTPEGRCFVSHQGQAVFWEVGREQGELEFNFDSGEKAYLAIMRWRKKAINTAVGVLRNKEARTPQTRWAIITLGDLRASAGVEALIAWIDYRYVPSGHLRDCQPALDSLVRIGGPARQGIFEGIADGAHAEKVKALWTALVLIDGESVALERLKSAISVEQDSARREALKACLGFVK